MLTLKAAGLVDVDAGEIVRPGILRIDGDRIAEVGGPAGPDDEVIDLGELILLPGLMDMEVNLLMGGRGETADRSPVQDDPPLRMLRAVGNARRTLRAGFTTVRNLGLFVKTGGYLLDVALAKAIDAGWIDGPRVVPAGHAITPTGGHLDPTMFGAFFPGVLPMTVEEGIADGVPEVRKAVRYQIKHGARLIKVCASGGVMSHTLISLAPCLIWYRTARRTSSTPSAIPSSTVNGSTPGANAANIVGSRWPPVGVIACPAGTIRGPSIQPASIALARATSSR